MNEYFANVKGFTDLRIKNLAKLSINNYIDLLNHAPKEYIDMSNITPLESAKDGDFVIAHVKILSKPTIRYIKKGMNIVDLTVSDGTCNIKCFYFNQPFAKNKDISKNYVLVGKLKINNGAKQFVNPSIVRQDLSPKGIVPEYRLTKGLNNKTMRQLIKIALEYYKNNGEISLGSFDMSVYEAYKNLHFPNDFESITLAKERLKYQEALYLTFAFKLLASQKKDAKNITVETSDEQEFINSCGFSLTQSQLKAMNTIKEDMINSKCMNRLLQGDVGCGKTIVAIFAMYLMTKAGFQSAFLAPTEVLAIQNYNAIKNLNLDINVALLTGSTKDKRELLRGLKAGEIDVLVGTHAILSDSVEFSKLNLLVADEQHRFGVRQRAKLANCHTLIMSATPIPRTLALIAFNNLSISVIDQLPKGRIPIKTHVIHPYKRKDMYDFIHGMCKQGKQAYVVCPLIEKSDSFEAKSATEIYKGIKKTYGDLNVALLHSKLKAVEKNEIMSKYKDGEIDVLVSTTVIEVGVNVPNACVMVIENCERFGLATLHQLRGRVGRGDMESFCFACLLGDTTTPNINIFKSENNGLNIAKQDLHLRGVGEFIGYSQHGENLFNFLDLYKDTVLIKKAMEEIENLEKNEYYNQLKQRVKMLYGNIFLDIALN